MRGTSAQRGLRLFCAAIAVAVASAQTSSSVCAVHPELAWCDASKSYVERAALLAAEMTLQEAAGQLSTFTPKGIAPAIPRLKLPAFPWHSEGLHGLRDSYQTVGQNATLFPQVTGMMATGNISALRTMALVMAREARALNNIAQERNATFPKGAGLMYWSPTMNLGRDPRWGRFQESLGTEGPFLGGLAGATVIRALQGPDALSKRGLLQVAATAKHVTAYSFEGTSHDAPVTRHSFNAIVSRGDLNASYNANFHAAVTQGGPAMVMCAYPAITVLGAYGDNHSRADAIPACLHGDILDGTIRDAWGWGAEDGLVVSDQGAIIDAAVGHAYSPDLAHASASAVAAGCDQNDGRVYNDHLPAAVAAGLVDVAAVNASLRRVLAVRFRSGIYDSEASVPYRTVPPSALDDDAGRAAALAAARESILLAKNGNATAGSEGRGPGAPGRSRAALRQDGPGAGTASRRSSGPQSAGGPVLPLRPGSIGTLAVLGPMADYPMSLMGAKEDYHPSFLTSHLSGVVGFLDSPAVAARVRDGQPLVGVEVGLIRTGHASADGRHLPPLPPPSATFATKSGPTVVFEQGCNVTRDFPGGAARAVSAASSADAVALFLGIDSTIEGEAHDRTFIGLPGVQEDLLRAVLAARRPGAPVVVVLVHGGPLSADLAMAEADAVLDAFEGGQSGGQALAEVLFGAVTPSGMAPSTVYPARYVDSVPMANMSFLAGPGRTYRYYTGAPLVPFGYTGSYTRFDVQWQEPPPETAPITAAGAITASARVTNVGDVPGSRPVLAFAALVTPEDGAGDSPYTPARQLFGIQKVHLRPGESVVVKFSTATGMSAATRAVGPRPLRVGEWTAGDREPSAADAVHDLSRGWCTFCDVSSSGARLVRAGRYRIEIGGDGSGTAQNGGVSAGVRLLPAAGGVAQLEVPFR